MTEPEKTTPTNERDPRSFPFRKIGDVGTWVSPGGGMFAAIQIGFAWDGAVSLVRLAVWDDRDSPLPGRLVIEPCSAQNYAKATL